MFHLLAYNLSHIVGTNVDITAVPDSIFTIQNGHFVPQDNLMVPFMAAMNVDILNARLNSPTLRQYSPRNFDATIAAILPPANPNVVDLRQNPLGISMLEELALEVSKAAGAGAAVTTGVVAVTRGLEPIPSGTVYCMRGTGTTAAVAGAWTQVAITWENSLPNGQYVACGIRHASTTGKAVRLIFEDQVYRPGALSSLTTQLQPWKPQINGGLGKFGRFNANRMPNVEVLCGAADNAHEILMDFIRVG